MICARNLSISFDSFNLAHITLEVCQGEAFFILGPSGAGKTLLLEALLGIKPPRSGTITIGGRDMTALPPEARRIAYVPQDLALFPHMTVRENILYGQKKLSGAEASAKLERWVELLNLGQVIDRTAIRTLSGGERQRVALARALIGEPSVLFMDEPFSALDASLRRRLQIEFRDLQKRLGLTLVQVTHDPEEAFLMADRMAILIGGRIEQMGRPDDLYNNPANRRVAQFLMLQNLYPGITGGLTPEGLREVAVRGITFQIQERPTMREGEEVLVGVRPEELILMRPDRITLPVDRPNFFFGKVAGWVDLGHYRLVRLNVCGLEMDCWLNIRAAREFPMAVGEEAGFHIRPRSFCVLPPDRKESP